MLKLLLRKIKQEREVRSRRGRVAIFSRMAKG
jgi:hypothetical protein